MKTHGKQVLGPRPRAAHPLACLMVQQVDKARHHLKTDSLTFLAA
jgi:hypothetical protein